MNDAEKIALEIAVQLLDAWIPRGEEGQREPVLQDVFDPEAPEVYQRIIMQYLAPLVQERDEFKAKQFLPGAWVCPKCNFICFKNVLYTHSGNIGPDTTSHFEICPNDMEQMQRLSWRDHCDGMATQLENRIKEIADIEITLSENAHLADGENCSLRRLNATLAELIRQRFDGTKFHG